MDTTTLEELAYCEVCALETKHVEGECAAPLHKQCVEEAMRKTESQVRMLRPVKVESERDLMEEVYAKAVDVYGPDVRFSGKVSLRSLEDESEYPIMHWTMKAEGEGGGFVQAGDADYRTALIMLSRALSVESVGERYTAQCPDD